MRLPATTIAPAIALLMSAAATITVPARAHEEGHAATLLSATPAAGKAASNVRTLSLTFSAPLTEKQSGAAIVMTGMPGMAQHKPMTVSGFQTALSADGRTLLLTLPRALPVGTYSLSWHAMTADGHRSEGRYAFSTR